MSVQLIIYPQFFDGVATPISAPPSSQEFVVDGIDFNTLNASTVYPLPSPVTFPPQSVLDANMPFPVNTWKIIGGTIYDTGSQIVLMGNVGDSLIQTLSGLVPNTIYEISVDFVANVIQTNFYQYSGTNLISSNIFIGTGVQTIQFAANTSTDTIVIQCVGAGSIFSSVSVIAALNVANLGYTIENGHVILDLYEDEDIPLSLSVDDFKNVAEKVQSYSKAFNLPATKRNNLIFDNIFEITRTEAGIGFNPYVKTKSVLKQDGFLLFEGYLRMIDITDKSGEISYNVNLYSETVALADVLKDRTFSDLDFSELEHQYNKTNIKLSWNDAAIGIIYTNAGTSGFREPYSTVKYPFIDWTGQTKLDPTTGFPILPVLESAFRPTIQLRYLLKRIFQNTEYSYASEFFDSDDFSKLYMDFNWGSNIQTVEGTGTYNQTVANPSTTAFTNLYLDDTNFPPELGWDSTNYRFVAPQNFTGYTIEYSFVVNVAAGTTLNVRWVHTDSSGNVLNVIDFNSLSLAGATNVLYSSNFQETLNQNDRLQAQFSTTLAADATQSTGNANFSTSVIATTGQIAGTNESLLQTLRGELGQWDFLKGIMNMFNLVSLPNNENPTVINFEPYTDVFHSSNDALNPSFFDSNSKELNWTEKVDISEMKLTPLTDLNKKTIFKFVEDDDDHTFNVYKNATTGFLYGSKEYDAEFIFNTSTVFTGEKEIVADPFAATLPKALYNQFPDFITPAIYSMSEEGAYEGFENSPRIFYNRGKQTLLNCTYFIPSQNGISSENADVFLQFSHIKNGGAILSDYKDFHFGECQIPANVAGTLNNLFNLYWLPYFNELYNPDTRTMTIKVNLNPADINTFHFYDTVMIKNRTYRVNNIEYKPNDLATVEFILIP